MSRKKYPMSEQDAQKMLTNTKELKGGYIMENVTNNNLVEDFDIDFDFDDLIEEELAPATNGATALAPEQQPKKATKKATRTKKTKLEVVKESDVALESTETATDDVLEAVPTNKIPQVKQQLTSAQKAQNGLTKLSHIETYLNEKFLEREEVIANVLRTLVVGSNMLLLGEPGTGKSDLIQTATQMIDGAEHFQWLVNRTSDPAELVGPYSIKAMEQDKFVRKTAGKLPEAHVAFIDEIKLGLLA